MATVYYAYMRVFPNLYTGNWQSDPLNNFRFYLPDNVNPLNTGFMKMAGDPSLAVYELDDVTFVGFFSLGDLPNGVTAIDFGSFEVWNAKVGSTGYIPGGYPNPQMFTLTTGSFAPGGWYGYDSTDLGISDPPVSPFDPATAGLTLLSGLWTIEGEARVAYGFATPQLPATGTTLPLYTGGGAVIPFPFSTFCPTVIKIQFTVDDTLCSALSPVTNVTVVDPVTGEISWTNPLAGEDGVIATITDGAGNVENQWLPAPISSLIPTSTGDLTIDLRCATKYPICKSTVKSISVTVTAPLVFTMGEDGISTGIFLGGTSALQFIGNPSGIYTLVPGKAYDTLYERIPTVTSQDVKIPDPFIITAYVGE